MNKNTLIKKLSIIALAPTIGVPVTAIELDNKKKKSKDVTVVIEIHNTLTEDKDGLQKVNAFLSDLSNH